MAFLDKPFGFAGERKAIALTCLAFYAAIFSLLSLLLSNAPPDQPEVRAWWACFAALGACYGLSFFALGADWFWARWFAIGLGYSGVTVAGWSLFTMRTLDPVMLFYGLTHGAIALFLQGQKLVEQFDAKPGWRETLHLDDNGVAKVRHTITRAAASLPTLILIALAPKEGRGELLLLAAAGLFGVLWLRTWGVLLLLGAAFAVPFAMEMANHEMGGQYPMTADDWAAAHGMFLAGSPEAAATESFGRGGTDVAGLGLMGDGAYAQGPTAMDGGGLGLYGGGQSGGSADPVGGGFGGIPGGYSAPTAPSSPGYCRTWSRTSRSSTGMSADRM